MTSGVIDEARCGDFSPCDDLYASTHIIRTSVQVSRIDRKQDEHSVKLGGFRGPPYHRCGGGRGPPRTVHNIPTARSRCLVIVG